MPGLYVPGFALRVVPELESRAPDPDNLCLKLQKGLEDVAPWQAFRERPSKRLRIFATGIYDAAAADCLNVGHLLEKTELLVEPAVGLAFFPKPVGSALATRPPNILPRTAVIVGILPHDERDVRVQVVVELPSDVSDLVPPGVASGDVGESPKTARRERDRDISE